MSELPPKGNPIRQLIGIFAFAAVGGIGAFGAAWFALPTGSSLAGFTVMGIALGVWIGVTVIAIARS